MNNSEMIEYKEGFISKIKNFFKRIFGKKEENTCETLQQINEVNDKQNNLVSEIKVDTKEIDSFIDKKNFLEEIDGNEEALKILSIDRLEKLSEYYDSVINKNNEIIKKLSETE